MFNDNALKKYCYTAEAEINMQRSKKNEKRNEPQFQYDSRRKIAKVKIQSFTRT